MFVLRTLLQSIGLDGVFATKDCKLNKIQLLGRERVALPRLPSQQLGLNKSTILEYSTWRVIATYKRVRFGSVG
jgi:hypothetical protein